MKLLSLFKHFYRILVIHAERSRQHFVLLGALGFFGHPLYYIIWSCIYIQPYENLTLRIISSLSSLLLMLCNYWPHKLEKFLPVYFYLAIFWNIPFYFNFMLLQNNVNLIWVISTMAGVFILILVVDWVSFFILFLLGSSVALYVFLFLGGSTENLFNYFGCMAVYIFLGIVGALFIYNTTRLQKERLEAMAALSGNVAHELRTPLLGLKSGITGLKKYLPMLYDAYEKAKSAGIEVPRARKIHLDNLLPALDRMDSEVRFSNTIIDMLLMNAGGNKINIENFEIKSIAESIQEALNRYPFDSAELEAKLHWNSANDFLYQGIPLLLDHIIFNLLKNALHFIVKAEKGEIFIWLEQHEKYNEVHFKDTGQGISPTVLPRLFERFFTTTLTGTGIGLSFCKAVMRGFGGSIYCESVEGKFAEFILKFPVVDASKVRPLQ